MLTTIIACIMMPDMSYAKIVMWTHVTTDMDTLALHYALGDHGPYSPIAFGGL